MRILHVLDHSIPQHSGYAFRTLAILEQQRAMGWETVQLTSPKHPGRYAAKETVDGWEFYRTRKVRWPISRIPVLRERALMKRLRRRLLRVVRQTRPDILHAHSPVLNAIPTIKVGRLRRIPVVYEVRAFWEDAAASHGTAREGGLRYRATRFLETRALRRANAVTTICEGLKADIIARGIPEERVTVIPNAVNITEFAGGGEPDFDLLRSLGLVDKSVLGFIGSFYSYEGLDLLLRAMPKIVKRRPETRLVLVGGGPEDVDLKRLALDLGVRGQVLFTGRVAHDRVQKYYDLIDVLVYPRKSRRITELVTPLKPLEAMALDKIIVASDVGGHRELIRDGETGNLFKADDIDDLAETVLRVLDNREDWPAQRAAGRRFVEHERSWADSVRRYKAVYEGLLAKKKRR